MSTSCLYRIALRLEIKEPDSTYILLGKKSTDCDFQRRLERGRENGSCGGAPETTLLHERCIYSEHTEGRQIWEKAAAQGLVSVLYKSVLGLA